jgi:peptide chain release factor subunit 1
MAISNTYSIYKELKRLRSIRGNGTELISVYIPAGTNISEETNRLHEENNESGNIKSKTTRTNVQAAIDKILQYLKLFRELPKNGLAVFCGNISDNPGRVNIELFSIEPPEPLNVNLYRCDSTFMLEPLEEILDTTDTYALLTLDGREGTLATLKGSHIHVIKKFTSMAHAKVRKGGQSARRYERAIEESIDDYYKVVGDSVNALFLENDFKIKGLVIGGPGPAKEGFVKANTLNYQIKILGVYDVGYTDETGLHDLLEKASELLKEQEALMERKTLERFMQEIARGGLATYGYEKTKNALMANQVAKLIINKELDSYYVKYKCNSCGEIIEKIEDNGHRESKHSCGGSLVVIESKDIAEELVEIAENKNVEIQFVSDESSYGKEFLMGFKGIGALLRYK